MRDRNAVETLIDKIAGELGFHRRLFRPFVVAAAGRPLTFQTIRSIRDAFAPTASLLAVMNAVVALWPRPALAFVARVRGRVRDDRLDRALRVEMQGRNGPARRSGLYMIPNMRVPKASAVHAAAQYKHERTECERLAIWDTSEGTRLPDLQALVSATPVGAQVYCLVSM